MKESEMTTIRRTQVSLGTKSGIQLTATFSYN